jgi:SOS-response transcriptional repressor LexA
VIDLVADDRPFRDGLRIAADVVRQFGEACSSAIPLTPRQNAVLDSIRDLTADKGYPPTDAEIAQRANMSRTRVRQHVDNLVDRGIVARECGTARSIRIVALPQKTV